MLLHPTPIDWAAPEYTPIFVERSQRLAYLRSNLSELPKLKAFYRDNIPQFINDWGVTVDPRVIAKDRPAVMPFVLFPRQVDWLEYTIERWRNQEPGLTEKSRDVGISWLAMALSVSLCLFHRSVQIGFGSAKEDKVDRSGDPDCLFYKGRMFAQYLPVEFRGEWTIKRNSAHMRLLFPETQGAITGEAGDNIGRGGRSSLYFVDEAAHLERPQLIDASLAGNTDARHDMSSVAGTANPFAVKAHSGAVKKFTFHYRDDPRKTQEWVEKKQAETDPVIWNQEFEINYAASVEGVVIPAQWVSAAIDAHIKLGIKPTGIETGALDVADQGRDKNAFALRHGIVLKNVDEWSGADMDIFGTTGKAFGLCDTYGLPGFHYDADGLGASCRGDARVINEARVIENVRKLIVLPFRGSGEVLDPERIVPKTDRKNEDFFANAKAQAWWSLRFRFEATFNAINGKPYNRDDLISIASDFKWRAKLCVELSQPVYKLNLAGKVLIDKAPEGVASPNLADAVMMVFAPKRLPLAIHESLLIPSPAHN